MMRPGTLSPPVRAADGYHILLVREQRTISAGDPGEIQVHLKQAAFPLKPNIDPKSQVNRIAEQAQRVQGCDGFEAALKSIGAEKVTDMGNVRAGDLSPDLARVVLSAPIGQVSPPFGNEKQAMVMVVCERKAPAAGGANRDAIYSRIGGERLDMLQRRLLADLHRAAYVDVRR